MLQRNVVASVFGETEVTTLGFSPSQSRALISEVVATEIVRNREVWIRSWLQAHLVSLSCHAHHDNLLGLIALALPDHYLDLAGTIDRLIGLNVFLYPLSPGWQLLHGYISQPWVLWTDDWLGDAQACPDDKRPVVSRAIIREGQFGGSSSLQTGLGFWAEVYELLMTRTRLSDHELRGQVQEIWERGGLRPLNPKSLPINPSQVAHRLTGPSRYKDPLQALAAVANHMSRLFALRLEQMSVGLELSDPPKEVAVVGKWASRQTFLAALQQEGFKTYLLPHALYPVHAAIAADALVRAEASPCLILALQDLKLL